MTPHLKWLLCLPSTLSPAETSGLEGFLEHPREPLDYHRFSDTSPERQLPDLINTIRGQE